MIYRTLLGGHRMPALGFGTWELEGDVCRQAVETALEVGYRHIDTAVRYGNEAAVGAALAASGVPREALFVTTKVWHDSLTAPAVRASAEASLGCLGLDYVDLLLVHWPNPEVPLEETLEAFAALQAEGLARSIGVSNFPVRLIEQAVDAIGARVATNQVEFHPFLDQSRLHAALEARGIVLSAYQPLAGSRALSEPVVVEIAAARGRTPAQIVLRWILQQEGTAAIPRSRNPVNIRRNFEIFDFTLSTAEMGRISRLRGERRFLTPSFAPEWDDGDASTDPTPKRSARRM
ncbi:aldo/keto reductase [Acuticoccus mangrovi]|uniref:Aldo/keto reductase n=1 Tax=Acuticoccus mangrovi TaxID=2796142 RepID=A0A934IKQ3_9HYPH|nr:aldo/keto reductase [Acuticoccus mangrovi]MBJ3778429.1 aldo/keto reductase [Acuticoccus mangrovi]